MKSSFYVYLGVFSAVALWGGTYLLLDYLLSAGAFPPSELIFIRYLGSLLLTIAFFRGKLLADTAAKKESGAGGASPPRPWLFATVAGLCLAGAAATQKYGIWWTGKPIQAAFLSALIAIFVPVLLWVMGNREVKWRKLAFPLLLATVGTALLCGFAMPTWGDILLIACAGFYALQAIYISKTKRYIHYAAGHAVACLACIAVAIVLYFIYDRGKVRMPSTAGEYLGIACLTVLSTFLPWNLIYWALAYHSLEPYRLGLAYTAEPVFTLVFGLLLIPAFGLPAEFTGLRGTAASLVGCALILWANERTLRL